MAQYETLIICGTVFLTFVSVTTIISISAVICKMRETMRH